MRCERAEELFSDYYEGSVQAAMLVPFEHHLDNCPSCREDLTELRKVWDLLDSAPVVEPPPGFRAAVWARLDTAKAQPARPALWNRVRQWFEPVPRPVLALAAAAVLFAALLPVVIPGRWSTAQLGVPGRLTSPVTPAVSPALTIGDARLESGRWIVPLTNRTKALLRVEITAGRGQVQSTYTVDVGPRTTLRHEIAAASFPQPIDITVSWVEGRALRTRLFELTPPVR